MDEPFSHLAPLYVDKIKKLIFEEKNNKAIIITDHVYKDIVDVFNTLYLITYGNSKLINRLNELEDYKDLSIGSIP